MIMGDCLCALAHWKPMKAFGVRQGGVGMRACTTRGRVGGVDWLWR